MTTTPAQSTYAPSYDRSGVTAGIVHIGVGGFHRAHQAMYLDTLLREGKAQDWGIVGVGVMPQDERMATVMSDQDCHYTLVLKHPDGKREATVIGSILRYLHAPSDPEAVLEAMTDPAIRIVSLTVTESGYNIDDETGKFREENTGAQHDASNPSEPTTSFGYIVEALRRRRAAQVPPFTVMSCDNLPGNGNVARTAVVSQARMSDEDLAQWIEENVAFPNAMVDRITPATTDEDRELVREEFGIEDGWPVTCEPFTQWVLEDSFADGRPPLEDVGVQLVEDVVPYEKMKLRLLNAAHQSLAHWGRPLAISYAHDAATDEDIAAVTRAFLEREAVPTLDEVPGIDVAEYIDTLFERFSNAAIADTLARLAYDGTGRMPTFVLPTIRDNRRADRDVTLGAAMCAAWAVGLEGQAEDGSTIEVEDPNLERLSTLIEKQKQGDTTALVGEEEIFGSLSKDEVFTRSFTEIYAQIKSEGVRGVMQRLTTEA